jgi:hypothetical protein
MENPNWDDVLNEINGNVPQPSNNIYSYEWGCSPYFVGNIAWTLSILCQTPFKEQIKQILKENNKSGIKDDEIQRTADVSWNKFVASLKLPGIGIAVGPNFDGDNLPYINEDSIIWKVTLKHLQDVGLDIDEFQVAVENGFTQPEDKERVKMFLCAILQLLTFIITDSTLHATYETLVKRIESIARNKHKHGFSSLLSTTRQAGGYKYDESEVIDVFYEMLTMKEEFLEDFFNIKEKSLSKIVSKAFSLVETISESESKPLDDP